MINCDWPIVKILYGEALCSNAVQDLCFYVPLNQFACLDFQRVSRAEAVDCAFSDDGEMRRQIKAFGNAPEIFGRREPFVVKGEQTECGGKTAQRFFAAVQKIFMEVGECEFSDRPVYGIAVSQYRMIGLTYRAPVIVFLEERYHVVRVAFCRFEVQEQRSFSVIPKRGCGKQRALNAMGILGLQDHKRGTACITIFFKIDLERIKKILNLAGGVQFFKNIKFSMAIVRKSSHTSSIAKNQNAWRTALSRSGLISSSAIRYPIGLPMRE